MTRRPKTTAPAPAAAPRLTNDPLDWLAAPEAEAGASQPAVAAEPAAPRKARGPRAAAPAAKAPKAARTRVAAKALPAAAVRISADPAPAPVETPATPRGEEGEAARAVARLLAEVRIVSAAHAAGDLDRRIEASAYPGDLGEVAQALNGMVEGQVRSIEEAVGCFEAIGEGNFDAGIRQWPGRMAMVNRVIDRFRANMKAVTAEVAMLSDSIVEGRLDREVDLSKFSGEFVEIVRSFERTYASLNGVFRSLSVQLEQTAQTVSQVSQASQSLATNSAVQSSSVDEVSASAEETDSQVKANAAAARSASLLVEGAATVAAEGREKVTEMVQAMEGIRISSQGIAKIIKVIDEIAFQTNLLALNAAVEAARAGQHGRGFAVVAHEVRNLAGRSAKAARETSELIEDAGTRVQAGVRIATETSRSFVSIVDDIEKVKVLVQDISRASDEQTRNVAQISTAIGEVAKSALSTSQQADELASSATQMQAAAEAMRTEIGRFKLREAREAALTLPALEALPPEMLAQLQQMVAAQMGLPAARPITAPAGAFRPAGAPCADRDERGFGDF
ncbi:methyl-accepting chemotaxis protein [Cereibacter johrii]|uniref:Methyl-accepting chemotaxis protein n=1 Tax=Cereibacter johrii TaxID=445629 RepID=A0ABX5JD69_9RHOB|nr:methyl-accepting chemotaxis protein [Cereibacter johrii]PTM80290.1 methyl-accepting chemotaxis protein [Cereibacter johrii]